MTPQQLAALVLSGVWRQGQGDVIAEYVITYPHVACRVSPAPHSNNYVRLICDAQVPDASQRRLISTETFQTVPEAVNAAMDWLENEAAPLMLTALPQRVRFRAGRGWRIGTVEASAGPDRVKIAAEDTGALILLHVSELRPHRENTFAC